MISRPHIAHRPGSISIMVLALSRRAVLMLPTLSLKKKPSEQYPSFQSNTGASETSTAYAMVAVMNPTSALRIQPCEPSKKALMRPRMSFRLRSALTRYASAMLSWTQSVEVNWSYHTRSPGSSEERKSLEWSRWWSRVSEEIRRELHDPARLWCRVLFKLPGERG